MVEYGIERGRSLCHVECLVGWALCTLISIALVKICLERRALTYAVSSIFLDCFTIVRYRVTRLWTLRNSHSVNQFETLVSVRLATIFGWRSRRERLVASVPHKLCWGEDFSRKGG